MNKGDNTGSKLDNVKAVILTGGVVAVSFIKVEPEPLRVFVEETLIQNNA